MKGLTGKVETAANIAVIAVALFLAWSVCRYYFGVGPKASVDTKLASGQKIHLNGIDWEGNHKTFLVAVAPGCGFCEQSASFFRLLAKEIDSDRHCRLVFLLPQSADDAAGYLDTLGVGGRTFIKASFKSLGIAGTPTIVLA
ncbi:MAG: hypothetical protein ACREAC_02825, partial [Blastocatellia bacterium]